MEKFSEVYKSNRMILKDVLPLDIPLCVSLEASNICNFKCVMCYHGSDEYAEMSKPLKNMDFDLFMKVIDDLKTWCVYKKKKIKVIKLYSIGEPLLHPLIGDMVRIVKDADICETLEITTNGSLLTHEIAESFVDYGLDYCRVSIYSIYPEKNQYITNSSVLPDTIKNNVEYLRKYRDENKKTHPYISAKMLDTYSEENELFKQMYANIADETYIDKIMNSNTGENVIEKLYREQENIALADKERFPVYSSHKACRYPFTHMTVRSDGKVVVCCSDWMKQTVVGDVHKQSMEAIWNSECLYDFRKMTLETKSMGCQICSQCELPLRGFEEDDIDDFPVDKLSFRR